MLLYLILTSVIWKSFDFFGCQTTLFLWGPGDCKDMTTSWWRLTLFYDHFLTIVTSIWSLRALCSLIARHKNCLVPQRWKEFKLTFFTYIQSQPVYLEAYLLLNGDCTWMLSAIQVILKSLIIMSQDDWTWLSCLNLLHIHLQAYHSLTLIAKGVEFRERGAPGPTRV